MNRREAGTDSVIFPPHPFRKVRKMLTKGLAVQEFIAEDELSTFEGWLKFQCIDAATITPDELEKWRGSFNESRM